MLNETFCPILAYIDTFLKYLQEYPVILTYNLFHCFFICGNFSEWLDTHLNQLLVLTIQNNFGELLHALIINKELFVYFVSFYNIFDGHYNVDLIIFVWEWF